MGDAIVHSALMKHPVCPSPGQVLFSPGGHRGGWPLVTRMPPVNTLRSKVGTGLHAPRDPRERLSGSTRGYSGVIPSSILQDPCSLAPFTLLPDIDPRDLLTWPFSLLRHCHPLPLLRFWKTLWSFRLPSS